MNRPLFKTAYCLVLVIFLAACQRPDGREDQPSENGSTQAELQRQVMEALQPYIDNPERSIDELKKLRQIEYEVFVVPFAGSPNALAQKLESLGKEHWDCFHIERMPNAAGTGDSLLVVCKRGAQTMLRYLPNGLL